MGSIWKWLLLIVGIMLIYAAAAAAAAGASTEGAGGLERLAAWVLGQSAVVTLIVNALKGHPWVRSHPKAVSNILNTLAVLAADFLFGLIPGQGLDAVLADLMTAVAAGFASSGWYEQVVKPGVTIVMPPK